MKEIANDVVKSLDLVLEWIKTHPKEATMQYFEVGFLFQLSETVKGKG